MQAYGNLMNRIAEQARQVAPQLGMGATITCWSDRHAATIVRVTPSQVHVTRDVTTRIDGNGMSECQRYTYATDPTAPITIFRRTKRGWRSANGNGLVIGERREYRDFSF